MRQASVSRFTSLATRYFLLTLPQSRLSEQFRQPHRQHYNRTKEIWRTTLQRRHFARDSVPSSMRTAADLPISPSSAAVARGTSTDSSSRYTRMCSRTRAQAASRYEYVFANTLNVLANPMQESLEKKIDLTEVSSSGPNVSGRLSLP